MRGLAIVIGLCTLSFLLEALPPSLASPVTFTFTPFDVPFTGGIFTSGNGINNSGQVVGGYSVFDPTINDFIDHGFLRDAQGNFSEIAFPGAVGGTDAKEINNQGQIVGRFFFASGGAHGYLLSDGMYSQIDVPFFNSVATKARGINDPGTIVGTYRDLSIMPRAASHERSFELNSVGFFSPIDFPGATFTHVSRINDREQIVGAYLDSNFHAHGFLLSQGTFSTIDFPDARETILTGINNRGEILGVYKDTASNVHSFLATQGSFMEIVLPGALGNTGGALLIDWFIQIGQPEVNAINDPGMITGSFRAVDGSIHGFIGTPTEPQ